MINYKLKGIFRLPFNFFIPLTPVLLLKKAVAYFLKQMIFIYHNVHEPDF